MPFKMVCDVIPKCPKCNLAVFFSGCGACGLLFNDRSWDTFPVWDPEAMERAALDAQGMGVARLIAAQVDTLF